MKVKFPEQPLAETWHSFELQQQQTFAAVAAVGTVAAVGVSAYSAYDAHQQAGDKAGAYGSKVVPVPYEDRIGTEDSYARKIIGETSKGIEEAFPELFNIANRVNANANKKREIASGGTFGATQRQEGANILAMERGEIPADVQDSITRMVAEHLGGAFDPSYKAGGFSMSSVASDAARRLGLTSLDIMSKGMSFAPAWRASVDSFIYKPQDAFKDFFLPQEQVGLAASELQLRRDENEYLSANNIARAAAMPNPQVVGGINDTLTSGAQAAQAISSGTKALGGLYGSVTNPQGTAIGNAQLATGTVPRATRVNPAYLGGTPYA